MSSTWGNRHGMFFFTRHMDACQTPSWKWEWTSIWIHLSNINNLLIKPNHQTLTLMSHRMLFIFDSLCKCGVPCKLEKSFSARSSSPNIWTSAMLEFHSGAVCSEPGFVVSDYGKPQRRPGAAVHREDKWFRLWVKKETVGGPSDGIHSCGHNSTQVSLDDIAATAERLKCQLR